jgi:hypothetical protein
MAVKSDYSSVATEHTKDRLRLLSPKQLSEVVFGGDISTSTLADWRMKGTGPRWGRAGKRVYYRWEWIDAWLEDRAVTSTAEAKLKAKT